MNRILKQMAEWRPRSPAGSQGAFTLVELAGIVLVLTCLLALGLPTIVRANQRSQGVNCRANLRRLALAMQAYTDSNTGSLPGPASVLVRAAYSESSTNELAWYLAGLLSGPSRAPRTPIVPELLCPAHGPTRTEKQELYATDYALADGSGKGPAPFGQLTGSAGAPLKLDALALLGRPDEQVAVSDADKANVNPTLSGWSALPTRPVHTKFRNQLYFDWHVVSKAR